MKQVLNTKWKLVSLDILVHLFIHVLLLLLYRGPEKLPLDAAIAQTAVSFVCVFAARSIAAVYRQIWRYGGIQVYIRLLAADAVGFFMTLILEELVLDRHITFTRSLSIACMNLLAALAMRMLYRYAFKCGNNSTLHGKFLMLLLRIFAGKDIGSLQDRSSDTVKVAIVGAGRVGVTLAEDLMNNPASSYVPRCFVDTNQEKIGRQIHGIPVLQEDEHIAERLQEHEVQEVVFAIPNLADGDKKGLYARYLNAGFRIKTYDYPMMQTADGKRQMREFDIEELLFRKPVTMSSEKTASYYRDKVILITGGGGSIGSELSRQIAKMQPKRLVLLDIYENGVYDVQQELRLQYGSSLDLRVEIVSVTNRQGVAKVFEAHRPQIVIHAAAHKHVPLMEHNCVEAVENNVFGTKNLVDLCEEYGAARFMMVSTDKAVNPTNVMGATKRMCEMIVQSAATKGKVVYSATRFGNVLGSAGSVIPLFKKQIANGGPITITDKRIIRYFMTIPEASQLVLQSGAMAKNGELFVLDMGQPVKIYDLAKSMIRLSGARDIAIVEIGLRPGEKLFEELLIKTENLDRTENSMIFIERDTPLAAEQIQRKLQLLQDACARGDDDLVRRTLKSAVPTYRDPEEVNAAAEKSEEMQNIRQVQTV